jgi:hypothetical protein
MLYTMSKTTPTALRVAMALRGWRAGDLASATGYSLQTIYNIFSGNGGKRARRKIEAVLGTRVWDNLDAKSSGQPEAEASCMGTDGTGGTQ